MTEAVPFATAITRTYSAIVYGLKWLFDDFGDRVMQEFHDIFGRQDPTKEGAQ